MVTTGATPASDQGSSEGKPVKDRARQYNIATFLLAPPTAGTFILMRTSEGTFQASMYVAAAVFGLAVSAVTFFKSRNESAVKEDLRRQQEKAQVQVSDVEFRAKTQMNGTLLGVADRLRAVAATTALKKPDISGFRSDAVQAAGLLLSNEAPRVAYFVVSNPTAANGREMTRDATFGPLRLDEFTSTFIENDETDSNVWELLKADDADYQPDIKLHTPKGFDTNRQRAYRSYVSVAVRVEGIEFGMLTANTREVDGFSPVDIAMLRVVARLLAAGEAAAMTSKDLNAARASNNTVETPTSISMIELKEADDDDDNE
ncbi:hypothetical protein [Rhodococcus sp. BH5]|uniref:hypothetical protein n=1 Tax=Rhodococcus sp. BH5 TaxID=2871702 RepID=UPI0022CD2508|nr:hypothetical protein [Rhodococcus sp. BH5]MCZ9634634.1 hypothetical protein [Rhodococcus sp. BH5]